MMYQNLQQVKEIYDQKKKELGSSCCSLDMPSTFIYSFIHSFFPSQDCKLIKQGPCLFS